MLKIKKKLAKKIKLQRKNFEKACEVRNFKELGFSNGKDLLDNIDDDSDRERALVEQAFLKGMEHALNIITK